MSQPALLVMVRRDAVVVVAVVINLPSDQNIYAHQFQIN